MNLFDLISWVSYESIKPYLEGTYFVVGAFLLMGVIVSYCQLKEFKKDLKIRNQRMAMEKALDLGKEFCGIMNGFPGLASGSSKEEVGDFTIKSLSSKPTQTRRELAQSLSANLNALESLSVCVQCGIADEDLAFRCFGGAFCLIIEDHYDLIVISKDQGVPDAFAETIELYKFWSNKIKRLKLDSIPVTKSRPPFGVG